METLAWRKAWKNLQQLALHAWRRGGRGGGETDKHKMREKERESSLSIDISSYLKTKEILLLKLVNSFLYETSAAVQPSRENPQKM